MPAPPETKHRLTAKFTKAIEALIDGIWDEAANATMADAAARVQQVFGGTVGGGIGGAVYGGRVPEPVRDSLAGQGKMEFSGPKAPVYDHPDSIALMSPQKRGAQNRERKGVVKNAIRDIIYSRPGGTSRTGIRETALRTKGLTIKDGSLKQGLRLLAKAGEIENRDRLWFPTKNDGQHG